jgi:putative oxidoreductase
MTTLTGYSDARSLRTTGDPLTRGRAATIALWTLQVAAALLFLFAGTSKLLGVAVMVQMFEAIGLGQWFRYVTGVIEVASAVLLLVPSLAFFGGAALAATMIGAIVTHVFVVGGNPAPAIVLLGVTGAVAWMRRPR